MKMRDGGEGGEGGGSQISQVNYLNFIKSWTVSFRPLPYDN